MLHSQWRATAELSFGFPVSKSFQKLMEGLLLRTLPRVDKARDRFLAALMRAIENAQRSADQELLRFSDHDAVFCGSSRLFCQINLVYCLIGSKHAASPTGLICVVQFPESRLQGLSTDGETGSLFDKRTR